MFERFAREAREATAAAQEEAAALGARRIEAEHLLLALAARGVAGLDHDEILEALDAEERASLAAVGIRVDDYDLPPAAGRPARGLRFGASAKTALERSLKAATAAGDRRITGGHLVLGLLDARHGRVPRALALAGIERVELARRARDER